MYDFKKGFDLIDHTTVMRGLLDMGLRPAYARWLSSFLQDQHQRIKMPDGSLSSWKPVTCGTPQGTLVGPVAFLAMVNGAAAQAQNRLKYVDDLTVYEACSVDDIQTESRLQQMTDQLCEWADEKKMVLNTDKCQIMHFFTAKKPIVVDRRPKDVCERGMVSYIRIIVSLITASPSQALTSPLLSVRTQRHHRRSKEPQS